jgi:nitroreductase
MKKDTLLNILKIAVHAPSGDNSQPWKFISDQNSLHVFNVKDGDPTLYNYKQRGSYFAHGALIENIEISAAEHGFKAHVEIFPDGARPEYTAKITWDTAPAANSMLYSAIVKRATNRKLYEKKPLEADVLERLNEQLTGLKYGKIRLISDQNIIKKISSIISLNEQLILENKTIHDTLFGFLRWSLEEEKKEHGMYIKTLELKNSQENLFKKLGNWHLVKILSITGFPKLLRAQSSKVYASSGAFGALIINSDEPKDFLNAGRMFQGYWLAATKEGLHIQPVTALPYLYQRISGGDRKNISDKHQKMIMEAYNQLDEIFGANKKPIAMIFRIGYSNPPSAVSAKDLPDITFKN